jgi:hypothetical protein
MDIKYHDDLWKALYDQWAAEGWEQRIECLMPMEGGTWEDGLVLGLHSKLRACNLATAISPALAQFDAWAILNTQGEWIESVAGGPLSAYFHLVGGSKGCTAQIFLSFDPNKPPEQAIDSLRNVYGRNVCLPVFHFRDGRILLLKSSEPARLIRARIASVARQIDSVCGCDAFGVTFSTDDRDIWETDSIANLSFGD